MAKVVMIAEYTLAANSQDRFEALMREYARSALEHFAHFEQFDVLLSRDDPNRAFVYEVFADDAAYQAYKTSGWVDRVRDTYADIVTDRRITRCLRP